MAGILDFLKKPAVQDAAVTAGTAAAFGPLGLLAYPFLRDDRERAAADLEAKRAMITGANRENELAKMRNDAIRNIPTLLSPGAPYTPEGRQAATVQSAAAMAPTLIGGAMGSAALPPAPTKPPALVALAEYLRNENPDLSMKDALGEASRLQNPADPADQLGLQKMMLEVQNMIDERTKGQEAEAETEQQLAWKLEDTAVNIQEMTHALDVLEGTPLQPGTFYNDWVKAGADVAQLGADLMDPGGETATRFRELRNAYGSFNKNSQLFVRNYLDAFMARGGTVTRDIQRLTASSSPNSKLPVDTIKTINALAAKDIIRRDEINDIKISAADRRELEKLISTWEKGHTGGYEFDTEQEAQAAVNAGLVEEGTVIEVGGRKMKAYKD